MASGEDIVDLLSLENGAVMTAQVVEGSDLVGLTVREADFQVRFGVHILAIRRPGTFIRDALVDARFQAGDILVLDGPREAFASLVECSEFAALQDVDSEHLSDVYQHSQSLIELIIPAESQLAGLTVEESGLGESLRLRIIGIARRSGSVYFPAADEKFQAGDQLLAVGRHESFELIRAIQSLELLENELEDGDQTPDREGLVEVTMSPRSSLPGRSFREIGFRQRYGLLVLSIWRRGRAYRSHLRNMRLEFGDALLLSGPPDRIAGLAKDPDFLILSRVPGRETSTRDSRKVALSAALMIAVVVTVLFGWLPIAIAAVAGAALMVAFRCLSMEDAYRAIDWKSVFLIAGMIPLGTAMESSGAAKWIAEGVSAVAEPFGLWGILLGIYLLTALATTIVPTTALVLIMAPIAIGTSVKMGLDPRLLMMGVALAASASFTSPISHPANVLVMGPGGYRFVDYVKMGAFLALVVMITVLPLVVWVYG